VDNIAMQRVRIQQLLEVMALTQKDIIQLHLIMMLTQKVIIHRLQISQLTQREKKELHLVDALIKKADIAL
jgi:hypothetical protein